jgi:hypothetical protein
MRYDEKCFPKIQYGDHSRLADNSETMQRSIIRLKQKVSQIMFRIYIFCIKNFKMFVTSDFGSNWTIPYILFAYLLVNTESNANGYLHIILDLHNVIYIFFSI